MMNTGFVKGKKIVFEDWFGIFDALKSDTREWPIKAIYYLGCDM